MRVLVTGGRHYGDRANVFRNLDLLHAVQPIGLVIHGACVETKVQGEQRRQELRGADRWAEEWALEREVPYVGHPAKWLGEGREAGPNRNAKMLEVYKPGVVLAFPGGRGTADMMRKATEAGIRLVKAAEPAVAEVQP
jgi:hypothetical protein